MIQKLGADQLSCPLCGETHSSDLIRFTRKILYRDNIIMTMEYYHQCQTSKALFQNDMDIIQTFINERRAKKNFDIALQQQQAQQQVPPGFNPGMNIRFN